MALSSSKAACEVCGLQLGLVVCPCRYPVAVLCAGCFNWHCRLAEQRSHTVFPLPLQELVKDKSNFDLMLPRIRKAEQTKAWFSVQIRHIELVEIQLEEVFSEVTTAVESWKLGLRRRLAELQEQMMACFDTAIELLDKSITALRPTQLSFLEHIDVEKFPQLITVHQSFKIVEVLASMLNIQLNLPKFEAPNQPSAAKIAQNCPETSLNLPLLCTNSLQIVSFPSLQITTCSVLNIVLDTDGNSCWAFLDSNSLFMCGGRAAGKRASLYSLFSQFLTKLSDMRVSRFMHCLVCFEELIYVFGGAEEAGKTAEKYSLDENRWFSLPPLITPKVGSAATLSNRYIYLFGGARSNTIERFSVDTEQLTELEAKLPAKAWVIALPLGEEVYLLQKDKVLLFGLFNCSALRKKASIPAGNWWSPTAAVLVNCSFSFLQYSGAVWSFSPDTFSLTKQPIKV